MSYDVFTITGFYLILFFGGLLSVLGLLFRSFSFRHDLASGMTMLGTLLFIVCALVVALCFIDSSPPDESVVLTDGTEHFGPWTSLYGDGDRRAGSGVEQLG